MDELNRTVLLNKLVQPNDPYALVPVFGQYAYRWREEEIARALRLAIGYPKTKDVITALTRHLTIKDMYDLAQTVRMQAVSLDRGCRWRSDEDKELNT
jgi:hypothetical protein